MRAAGLALGALLTSCVGGPHPEPPRANMDAPGRPTLPATDLGTPPTGATPMMGAGGASTPGAAALPPQSVPAAAEAPAGGAAATVGGAGGTSGRDNAACPPLDGGVPDAGMTDAGADAGHADCDDDGGV